MLNRKDQWHIEKIPLTTHQHQLARVELLGGVKVLDCWELLVYTAGLGRFLSRVNQTEKELQYLIYGSEMPRADPSSFQSVQEIIEVEFAQLKQWIEKDSSQSTGEAGEAVQKVRKELRFPDDAKFYFFHAGELQIAGWGFSKDAEFKTTSLKKVEIIERIAKEVATRFGVTLNQDFLKEREADIRKTDADDKAKSDKFKGLETMLRKADTSQQDFSKNFSILKSTMNQLEQKLIANSKQVTTLSSQFDTRMLWVAFSCLLAVPVLATFTTWYLTKETLRKQLVTQSTNVLAPNQAPPTGSTPDASGTNSNKPKGSN